MKPAFAAFSLPFLLAGPVPFGGEPAQESTQATPSDCAALFSALAFAQEEREECLALALSVAMGGDCEGGLAWLDAVAGAGVGDDELIRRFAIERRRLQAWIELRDAYLAELATSGKPLALELDGKKVSTPITREGDELVLARGPRKRLSVRALAPEPLLAAIPKERFAEGNEWLKIYPYCVTGNPKWKRLTTTEASSAELKRDAEEFYPRLAALGPVVQAIERLAEATPPAEPGAARAALTEIEALLALGRELPCVRARQTALGALAAHLLARISESMEVGDLLHVGVKSSASPSPEGTLCLAYDFSSAAQGEDWRSDDAYLVELRRQLDPVSANDGAARFAPGPKGFAGNGESCWRHALEFLAPLRVRYRVRWEPYEDRPNKAFAFAVGMMANQAERHLRAHELGFLYVHEQDGPYATARPNGDATVQLGKTYAIELVHDGQDVQVWVDGVLRSQASAKACTEGGVFLWCHSDLLISVPSLEIEGRVTPGSLAALRAQWARAELDTLGLAPPR